MKNYTVLILIFFASLFFCTDISSQWLNPTPFGMVKTSAGFYLNNSKTYIAGDNGTIAYTPNLGQNWNITYNNRNMNLKNIFIVNPSKGFAVGEPGKILRMTDGYIWTEIYSISNSNLLGLYFTDENTGYVAGGHGAFLKTTNSGNNWQSISYSDKDIYKIQFINPNTGFVVDYSSVMKTTNAGTNWFTISDASIPSPQTISFLNENTGYTAGTLALYKTTNGGVNWISKYSLSGTSSGLCFTDTQTTFITEGKSVSRTTDGGETWTRTILSDLYNMSGLVFMNQTTGIVFEQWGKIFRTTDGGETWNLTTKYFTDSHISDVKSSGTKLAWACIGNTYLFRTSNGGSKWDSIALGANSINSVAIADSINLWGFGNGGLLGHSTNKGLNWSFQTHPFTNNVTGGKFLNKTTGWLYGENGSMYKTTNEGNNWTDVSIGPNAFISKVQFLNSQTGWVSSSGGFYRLYKTTNGGTNWVGSFIDINNTYTKSISFVNENTGYVLGDNVFSKTTDGGNSWVEKSLNFSGARDLFFYTSFYGYCMSSDSKIYSTIDGGVTWYPSIDYSTAYSLNSMYYEAANYTILFGGTFGTVIKYQIQPIDNIHQLSSTADKYSLLQNYPNPFNPSTKINYKIKSSGIVSLKVFDLLGKEVATLVNEKQNSGSYAVDFNSSEFNLPSGIYFYTLNAGGFKETRKMVLMK